MATDLTVQTLATDTYGDPWPNYYGYCQPYVVPQPPLIYNWIATSKSIQDFSDEELVAELKRRKRGRDALDQITIKEDRCAT